MLIRAADGDGRCWPGIRTLIRKTEIKTNRTLQKALDQLVRDGWLRIVPQTWESLAEAQALAGKKPPRRGDLGQATNLYVVLDGHCREIGNGGASHPGLARTSKNTPPEETPLQKDIGGPLQKDTGEPPAKMHPDPDQGGIPSKEESVEIALPVDHDTHNFSNSSKSTQENLEVWNVIVEAHVEKTKAAYGLAPLPPDMKRTDRLALARLLDDAAAEVRGKIHARTSIERPLVEVQRELAKRTMDQYFNHDNEHLRRVKHALRDLPREFHARLTEAMQALLRDSHNAGQPRRVQLEQPIVQAKPEDKPAEIEPKTPIEPTPVRVESADKPADVAPPKPPKRVVHAEVARGAREVLEALKASTAQEELFKPTTTEAKKPEEPAKQALPERKLVTPEQPNIANDQPPVMTSKKFEPQPLEHKPLPKPQPPARVERPLGRTGAPRWGDIGPRPTKARRWKNPTPDVTEHTEEHGVDSTLQK